MGVDNFYILYVAEELEALKEEFTHHQDKVDEYMSLLTDVESGDPKKHESSFSLANLRIKTFSV